MLMITLYAGLLDFLQTKTTVFFVGPPLTTGFTSFFLSFQTLKKNTALPLLKLFVLNISMEGNNCVLF